MARERCDGCGQSIAAGGGFVNLWKFGSDSTGGMTLELVDGTEHFLCYDCMDKLPDDRDVVAEDVEALSTQ